MDDEHDLPHFADAPYQDINPQYGGPTSPSVSAHMDQSAGPSNRFPATAFGPWHQPITNLQTFLNPYTASAPRIISSHLQSPVSIATPDDAHNAYIRGDSVALEGSLWSPPQNSLALASVSSYSPNLAAWGLPGQSGGLDVEYQASDAGGTVRHREDTPMPLLGRPGIGHANDVLWRRSAYEEALPRSLPFLGIWRTSGEGSGTRENSVDAGGSGMSDLVHEGTSGLSQDSVDEADLSKRVADRYLERYHPLFPILDEPTIRYASTPSAVDAATSAALDPALLDDKALLFSSMLQLVQAQETLDKVEPDRSTTPPHPGPAHHASFRPFRLATKAGQDVEAIMTAYHRFVAYVALGDRQIAWMYLQDAITLMLSCLGKPFKTFEEEARAYRLYSMLHLTERICVPHHLHPSWHPQPLRLPDDTFNQTPFTSRVFSMDVMQGFPVPQLRLFGTLIVSSNVGCWKGTCAGSAGSAGCPMWTAKDAQSVLGVLEQEMQCAKEALVPSGEIDGAGEDIARGAVSGIERAKRLNWIVTIAWVRDRVWNILYRHNQVGLRRAVNLDSVYHNLRGMIDSCKSIDTNDLIVWLDWDVKLYDMAKTVLAILRTLPCSDQLREACVELLEDVSDVLATVSHTTQRRG